VRCSNAGNGEEDSRYRTEEMHLDDLAHGGGGGRKPTRWLCLQVRRICEAGKGSGR
jgi:hypothetical protein